MNETSLSVDSKDSVAKNPRQENKLTHKQIMKIIPADVCRGCLIRPLVCKKKWISHPSFHCNGINLVTKILEASRNE
jgi:hypothetical protein